MQILPFFCSCLLLFSVKHFFSFSVHGAERKHSVGEDAGEKREELEEKRIHRRGQHVSVLGLTGRDGVQQGIDDHVGVLEPRPACGHEVLVGQIDVLAVEDLLFFVVQLLPNIQT